MYPYIEIFGAPIRVWAIFAVIASTVPLIAMLIAKPYDFPLDRRRIAVIALTYTFAGWFGSTTLHMIIYAARYVNLHQGAPEYIGTASLGAPLAGLLVLWVFSKGAKFSFLEFADLSEPYVALVLAFTRIGCLFAGCCYGIATKLPWGFVFLADGVIRHPTQAYAMAADFAVFGASRFIYKKLRNYRGFTFFYVIFTYSFLRFFNEFLRAEGPFIAGRIKLVHPFLLLFMVIGTVGMLKAIRPANKAEKRKIRDVLLSGGTLRLLIWFISSIIFPLAAIYISNRIWL